MSKKNFKGFSVGRSEDVAVPRPIFLETGIEGGFPQYDVVLTTKNDYGEYIRLLGIKDGRIERIPFAQHTGFETESNGRVKIS